MKVRFVASVVVLIGSSASAQPAPPIPAEPEPGDAMLAPVEPAPVVDPAPPPARRDVRGEPRDDHRPSAYAIGIGLGYDLPADLQAPNVTSVRFRLASGLTFEPILIAGQSADKTELAMTTSEDKAHQYAIGSLVRVPIRRHGRVDLELLGAALIDRFASYPDGPDNDLRTTAFSVSWGIALGYWISPHWQLTMSAFNPLFVSTKREQDTGPMTSVKTTDTLYGAFFDPNVVAMVHMLL